MAQSKIRLLPVAGIAAVGLVLAACSGDDDSTGSSDGGSEFDLVSAGSLTVCSEVPYPPFEVEDASAPSGYSGFDIDLMQEIADSLDLELVVQNVDFSALQSGTVLVAGQCDLGASAITITEERAANIDFSDPYYDSLQSLLVRADSGFETLADLDGAVIGVQNGTTGQNYAEENAPEGATLQQYSGDGELWPALQASQIDAILQDQPVNVVHERDDSTYVIVEEYNTDEQYGFAFAKDQRVELREAVNDALAELRDSGRYQEIYDSYFSADE